MFGFKRQSDVFNFTLDLKGTRLAVRRQDGTAYRFVNLKNWRLSKPAAR